MNLLTDLVDSLARSDGTFHDACERLRIYN